MSNRIDIEDMRDWLRDFILNSVIDISDDGTGAENIESECAVMVGYQDETGEYPLLRDVIDWLDNATDAEIAEAYVRLKFNDVKR